MRLALRCGRQGWTIEYAPLAVLVVMLCGCGRIGFASIDRSDTAARKDSGPGAQTMLDGAPSQLDGALANLDAALANLDAAITQLDPGVSMPVTFDAGSLRDDAASPIGTGTGLASDAAIADDAAGIASAVTKLARGFSHTYFIESGQMSCWGLNTSGQLGVGDKTNRMQPTPVTGRWLDACGGEAASCGIQDDGALYCWGDNSKGQLGTNDRTARSLPTRVGTATDWAQVSCIGYFVCALRSAGGLWCWGENLEGAVGQDDSDGAPDVLVPMPVTQGMSYRMVSAAQGSACAIRSDGALLCWGRNKMGQLAIGSTSPMHLRAPTRVGSDSDWQSVAAGQEQTLAVRTDGTLWSWGDEAEGARAVMTTVTPLTTPTRALGPTNWKQITSSRLGSCGVTIDGALYCWGRGQEGQLGNGATSAVRAPTRVGTDRDWQEVGIGFFFACARRADASVWCWGENDKGQLGLNDNMRRAAPAQLSFP